LWFVVCGWGHTQDLPVAEKQPHKRQTTNCKPQTNRMNPIRKFYQDYKPYIFSDGWYYVFILVFILLLFIFFS